MIGKLSTLIASTHLLKKQFLQDLAENINSNILPNYDITDIESNSDYMKSSNQLKPFEIDERIHIE